MQTHIIDRFTNHFFKSVVFLLAIPGIPIAAVTYGYMMVLVFENWPTWLAWITYAAHINCFLAYGAWIDARKERQL